MVIPGVIVGPYSCHLQNTYNAMQTSVVRESVNSAIFDPTLLPSKPSNRVTSPVFAREFHGLLWYIAASLLAPTGECGAILYDL